jgi:hypothetical protein
MESLVVSAFVTILLIYMSGFVRPTNIKHIDNFTAYIKSSKSKMHHAVVFSILVAFLTDYILFLSLD